MRKLYSILILIALFISGCSNNTSQPTATTALQSTSIIISTKTAQTEALNNYISVRISSVNNKDMDSFLSLFDSSDQFYINEQKAWFNDLKKQDIKNYTIKIVSAAKINDDSFAATLTETFLLSNVKRSYTYTLLFMSFEDGYKEIGMNMNLLELDGFNVYYDEKAKEYANEIKIIYNTKTKTLYKLFNYSPSFIGQAKVYASMTTMQGTIKPSTPTWVAGWNEYMQSIKIGCYANVSFSTIKDYIDETILHEQTHSMLSDLSNDNLTYFLQEGFAQLFSSDKYELTDNDKKALKELYSNNYYLLDLATLEKTHLETLQSPASNNYYLISKAYGYIIYKDYGINKIKTLLSELKNSEYIELSSDDKLDTINTRTNNALKKVIGEDTATLTKKLNDYLAALK